MPTNRTSCRCVPGMPGSRHAMGEARPWESPTCADRSAGRGPHHAGPRRTHPPVRGGTGPGHGRGHPHAASSPSGSGRPDGLPSRHTGFPDCTRAHTGPSSRAVRQSPFRWTRHCGPQGRQWPHATAPVTGQDPRARLLPAPGRCAGRGCTGSPRSPRYPEASAGWTDHPG